jgi:hypothetical protein
MTPDPIGSVSWQDAIAYCHERTCYEYSRSFFDAAQKAKEVGDETRRSFLLMLGFVTSLRLDSSARSAPFSSPAGHRPVDGSILNELGPDHVKVLKALTNDEIDPELRARISDVLWVKEHDHRTAEQAIDSYLKSASNLEDPKHWPPCVERIERALRLAAQLGMTGTQFLKAVAHVESVLDRYRCEDELFLSRRLMSLLVEFGTGDPKKYGALADKAALEGEKHHDWEKARDYWRLKANWCALAKDPVEQRTAELRAAETYVGQAKEHAAGTPPSFLMASIQLQSAVQALRNIQGAKERADEVHRLMLDYQRRSVNEMKGPVMEDDFTDTAKKAKQVVMGKSLIEAIFALARMLKSPSVVDLRTEVEKNIRDYPLIHAFETQVVNAEGNVTALRPGRSLSSSSPSVADLEPEMFSAAAMKHDDLAFGIVEPARQQICVDHHVRLDDFAPIVIDNLFVPPRHEHIYARGLFAGLTGDWIAAGQILAPQMENSIRYVLMQTGAIPKSLSPKGIQADILLDSLLRKPELERTLGADIVFDLRGLLVEKLGSNLRHLIAHGLVDQWDLISMRVRYMWWLALRLCCLPKVRVLFSAPEADSAQTGPADNEQPVRSE